MKAKIISMFETLSLEDMDNIIQDLEEIYSEKFVENFVSLQIITSKGNINGIIEMETGFRCDYAHSSVGGRGANIIRIPRSICTKELREELFSKYNDTF